MQAILVTRVTVHSLSGQHSVGLLKAIAVFTSEEPVVIGSSRLSSRRRVRSRSHPVLVQVPSAPRSLMVAVPRDSAPLAAVVARWALLTAEDLLPGGLLVSARPVAKVMAPEGFQDRRVSTESVLKAT